MTAAYRALGKKAIVTVIDTLREDVSSALVELYRLRRTLGLRPRPHRYAVNGPG